MMTLFLLDPVDKYWRFHLVGRLNPDYFYAILSREKLSNSQNGRIGGELPASAVGRSPEPGFRQATDPARRRERPIHLRHRLDRGRRAALAAPQPRVSDQEHGPGKRSQPKAPRSRGEPKGRSHRQAA